MWSGESLDLKSIKETFESRNVSCDNYKARMNESTKSDLTLFLNDIVTTEHIEMPKSIYFTSQLYMTYELMMGFFASFKKIADQIDMVKTPTYNYDFLAVDNTRSTSDEDYHFSVTIRTKREFDYAMGLYKVYTSLVEPFLQNYSNSYLGTDKNLARLFFISASSEATRRSIHDTSRAFEVNLNQAVMYIDNDGNLQTDENYKSPSESPKYVSLYYNLGHVANFRNDVNFNLQTIPVEAFGVDLDYFKCYMIPALKKLVPDD